MRTKPREIPDNIHRPSRPQDRGAGGAGQRIEVGRNQDNHIAAQQSRPDVRCKLKCDEPLGPDGGTRVSSYGGNRSRVVESFSRIIFVLNQDDSGGVLLHLLRDRLTGDFLRSFRAEQIHFPPPPFQGCLSQF